MKIKLIKTGGIAGKKMSAVAATNFNQADWDTLIRLIKREEKGPGKKRDAFNYQLQQDDDDSTKTPIHIQDIPEKYRAVFKELFENMKVEK